MSDGYYGFLGYARNDRKIVQADVGSDGAPPVAEKATKASGSGRQSTQAKAKENAGHRNRTSVPTGEIGMLGLRAVEGAGPYGKDWNG